MIPAPPLATRSAIGAMVAAVEAVCRSLRIESRDDPRAEVVALKVVEAAKAGERDPERLRDFVFRSLGLGPQHDA